MTHTFAYQRIGCSLRFSSDEAADDAEKKIAAAPRTKQERDALYEALIDCLGSSDLVFDENGDFECIGCGRVYDRIVDGIVSAATTCPDDSCPRHKARTALALVDGKETHASK